jgi:hypothetical protein
MEFDAVLFGNGLTLCYQKQIQSLIPEKYKHALYFDDYIEAIMNNSTTPREKNMLLKMFKPGYNYSFDLILKELRKAKEEFGRGFEWTWGKLITDPSHFADYKVIVDCLPILYNLWYCNLQSLINFLGIQGTQTTFAQSLRQYLQKDGRIFTTNFDGFFDVLCPEHIHGHFVKNLSNYRDLIWHKTSSDEFYYPFIWAPAEVGKMDMIEKFEQIMSNREYFNFDFFHHQFRAHNMLIFGMGFSRAGYMEGLEEYDSKYGRYSFGSCIDDHIIIRLQHLQKSGFLGKVSFAYYDELSQRHYQKIISDYELQDADVIPSSCFDLKVM